MKTVIFILFSLFFSLPASASEILATLETVQGGEAYLVSEAPVQFESAVVLFGAISIELDGEHYRISQNSQSAIEALLCEPLKADYPYPYSTLESRKLGLLGFGGEKVVEITADGRVARIQDEAANIVIDTSSCGKEMY